MRSSWKPSLASNFDVTNLLMSSSVRSSSLRCGRPRKLSSKLAHGRPAGHASFDVGGQIYHIKNKIREPGLATGTLIEAVNHHEEVLSAADVEHQFP